MSEADSKTTASVLGDFVLAYGQGTNDWVRELEGFTPLTDPSEPVQVVRRGAVGHGGRREGARWAAISDLIEGDLDEGVLALEDAAIPHEAWRGRFACLAWNAANQRIALVTDHFSTLSIYVLIRNGVLLAATDLRLLSASPWCARTLDLESIYHYCNFAQIPAPKTIFTDIRRLEPGTRFRWDGDRSRTLESRYFLPEYPDDLRGSDEELAVDLRERMIASVEAYGPTTGNWGCFLSGGTDSSSIVSILSRQRGAGRVRSFSIGFEEQGYDELTYAETAARACGANPTFARVSRKQAERLISRVVEGYDQPFGNASAIPTIACVDLARERDLDVLLAGDGGDEIFGGNERYAKDKIMEAWFGMPGGVKRLGKGIGRVAGRSKLHLLNRVENFFDRASLPNPDRFYSDDSFVSDHYEEILSSDFRLAVPADASLEFMRSVYGLGSKATPLHRIMRLDLLMAIAQNDLRKVHGAARSAGISVRFPYLDPILVRYANRLGESWKVRGLEKRYLFRRAMRSILPAAILRKKKQGFGLPIAVWLRKDSAFKDTVRDTLFGSRARSRGWWSPDFVERLLNEHLEGRWDHADSIWRLFILELWLQRYGDAH